jgi:uncharacterized protein YigE (DUF2233 family)
VRRGRRAARGRLRAGVGAVLSALATAAPAQGRAADAVVFEVPDVGGLQLFLRAKDGAAFGSLEAVKAAVAATGHRVVFAMNAGMYEPDRSPTGLFVQDGRQVAPLDVQSRSQDARTPNFYLAPNGVFAVTAAGPVILSTSAFARSPPPRVRLATQSGPLLLTGGTIAAPAVAAGTDAPGRRNRRNGICVNGGRVLLVEADAMTLHQFALHLRDVLKCRDALYMDGVISSVLDARTGRSDPVDPGNPLGPIIAYVE